MTYIPLSLVSVGPDNIYPSFTSFSWARHYIPLSLVLIRPDNILYPSFTTFSRARRHILLSLVSTGPDDISLQISVGPQKRNFPLHFPVPLVRKARHQPFHLGKAPAGVTVFTLTYTSLAVRFGRSPVQPAALHTQFVKLWLFACGSDVTQFNQQ